MEMNNTHGHTRGSTDMTVEICGDIEEEILRYGRCSRNARLPGVILHRGDGMCIYQLKRLVHLDFAIPERSQ